MLLLNPKFGIAKVIIV